MERYIYDNYLKILEEEVVIAQGCTEPIAGALTGAIAKKHLGDDIIKEIKIIASQNIVKNARGVIIPNTDDLMGVEPSVVLGAFFGDPNKNMEVLCNVIPEDVTFAKKFLANGKISLEISDSPAKLFLSVELIGENGNQSKAEIVHLHTNVVYIEENHKKITSVDYDPNNFNSFDSDRTIMTIDSVYDFVREVEINDLDLIKQQIYIKN